MSILPLFTDDLLYETKEIQDLFRKYFKEALYDRKEKYALKMEEQAKYQEIIDKFNEIIGCLLDREETKEIGLELESWLGNFAAFISNEFYENGIRDGYILAGLLDGDKFL